MSAVERDVTRREIAEAVGEAFGVGQVGREQLVAAALLSDARPGVIELLQGLPGREFNDLRQLWSELPELPVG